VIVGDGPLRKDLQAEAKALGMGDRIHFTGWREDVRAMYPAFDIFVMPSLWEGFGLVALEAMAARLPIIASNVSALPEIIANRDIGYLVNAASPIVFVQLLASRMGMMAGDVAAARQMGLNGREWLEREFAVGKMVERTAMVYSLDN
jgi:glycosyltransferase involved in cell wall biosynthesis